MLLNIGYFRALRTNAMAYKVKDIIDMLVKKHGSLRNVAEIYGISHQNLSNWRKGSKVQCSMNTFLEAARADLKLSKSKAWDLCRGKLD